MSRLQDRKRSILARVNRKYNSKSSSLQSLEKAGTRLHPINFVDYDSQPPLPSSMKSTSESREDYIEKLKKRIRQLEQSPLEKTSGASRFDFSIPSSPDNNTEYNIGSSAAANNNGYNNGRKQQNQKPKKHLEPLSPASSEPISPPSTKHTKPPASPPIVSRGSYDLSKHKLLGPIPSSSSSKSSSSKSNMTASTQSSTKSAIPESDPTMRLEPCDICGRSFRVERLEKHKEACEKTRIKKRPVFDEKKMRLKGTELENFKGNSANDSQGGGGSDSKASKKKSMFATYSSSNNFLFRAQIKSYSIKSESSLRPSY